MLIFCADVFLGDAQRGFHLQLHGKAVGIPAGFAFHQVSLHGFVAAENILDGTGNHMVNAGHAVGRGGPFIEHVEWFALADLQTLFKGFLFVPYTEYLPVDGR